MMDESSRDYVEDYFIATARHTDRNDNEQPEPFRIESDILWSDFKAVVKAQYEYVPQDILIKYLDEDNELITMTSQDELFEAMRIARCNGGIMQLEVKCINNKDSDEYTVVDQIDASLILPPIPLRSSQSSQQDIESDSVTDSTNVDVVDSSNDRVVQREEPQVPVSSTEELIDNSSPVDSTNEYEQLESEVIESMPYATFVEFMAKLKQELRNEIVHDVTKKTVKQVLKGLDNPVSVKTDVGPWGSKKEDIRNAHPVYLHEGVVCNNCQKTILGVRYKCGNCSDFDLCERCEAKYGVHNSEHVFIKLRRPCKDNLYRDGKRTPLLKRVLYKPEPMLHESRSFERKQEKLMKKVEKLQEKEKRKEEKLKRKLEKYDGLKTSPKKREKCDLLRAPMLQHIHSSDLINTSFGAAFVRDITIPDGTTVQPGTKLYKTWRLLNTGNSTWKKSTMLRLMYGTIPAIKTEVSVPGLKPGEEGDITAELIAPDEPGRYQSHWKLFNQGLAFGHRVWLLINVVPREILEPKSVEPLRVIEMTDISSTQKLIKTEAPEEQTVDRDGDINISKSERPLYRLIPSMLEEVDDDNGEEEKIVDSQPLQFQKAMNLSAADDSSPVDLQPAIVNDLNKLSSDVSHIDSINIEAPETDKVELNLTSAVAAMEKLSVSQPVDVPNNTYQAKDLVSFEFLEIATPKQSQTATPSNTPLDVSPPKSPIPTPRLETVLSASSSMELVNGELDETVPLLTQTPHERIRSLELRPGLLDDVESIDTCSEDEDSSFSDDFYVVPLPDCFDTTKPLTRSVMLQQQEQQQQQEDNDADIDDDDYEDAILNDIVNIQNEDENSNVIICEGSIQQPSVDDMLQVSASVDIRPLTPEVTSPEIPRDATGKGEASSEVISVIPSTSDGACGQSIEGTAFDSSCYAAACGRPLTDSEHQTQVLQVDEACSAPSTDRNEATSQPDATSTASGTNAVQQEFAKQLFDVAITTAATAASNAYFKVKEVIHTWQAKDMDRQHQENVAQNIKVNSDWMPPSKKESYKPPVNEWTPPEDNYIPPKSNWTPPVNNYKPPQSTWTNDKERSPMDQMLEMGFCNRQLNKELLEKYNNDVEKAISSLIEMNKDNWASERH